jgi:hypothetical protein
MVAIESHALVVVAWVVATVGWGLRLKARHLAGWVLGCPWRFELYGGDFLCGILFLAILWALTMGGGRVMVSWLARRKARFALADGLNSASPVAALGGVWGGSEFAAAPPVADQLFGGRFTCWLIGLVLVVMIGPVEYGV